ncbi:MAG: hypothetical protein ABI321_09275 [Polyangia bacterium]
MVRASLVLALLVIAGNARAELPPLVGEERVEPRSPSPPATEARTTQVRLSSALHRFEFGDYEAVVAELESLVEARATALSLADRLEALRAYGIACVLVGRRTAAEGAFLLLLEADPAAAMDPALVRPEAVQVFDDVRTRNRATLRAAYTRGRGRRHAVLNLLPPAGQLQNHEYKKGYTLLGIELALIALDVTSGSLLYSWRGSHQDFPGHADAARALRPVNWVSFGTLIGVALYGIIDGFVVGHRRAAEEQRALDRFGPPQAKHTSVALDLTQGGVGVRF